MDSRTDTAIIDVAGDEISGRRITGSFRQFDKKQLTLAAPEEIRPSTPVFVHSRELIFLGEVHKCLAPIGGEYTIEIAVRQAIARL